METDSRVNRIYGPPDGARRTYPTPQTYSRYDGFAIAALKLSRYLLPRLVPSMSRWIRHE
jgi:hypothetical protein